MKESSPVALFECAVPRNIALILRKEKHQTETQLLSRPGEVASSSQDHIERRQQPLPLTHCIHVCKLWEETNDYTAHKKVYSCSTTEVI